MLEETETAVVDQKKLDTVDMNTTSNFTVNGVDSSLTENSSDMDHSNLDSTHITVADRNFEQIDDIGPNKSAQPMNEGRELQSNVPVECELTPRKSRFGRIQKPKACDDFVLTIHKSPKLKATDLLDSSKARKRLSLGNSQNNYRNKSRGRKRKAEPLEGSTQKKVKECGDSRNVNGVDQIGDRITANEPVVSTVTGEPNTVKASVNVSTEWNPGDLVWARVGRYPYWPSMVSPYGRSRIFSQLMQKHRTQRKMIHVQYFGDSGKRNWIAALSLFPFKGLDDFNNLAKQYNQDKKMKNLALGFSVRPTLKYKWSEAVKEAEMVCDWSREKRISYFADQYPIEYSTDEEEEEEEEAKCLPGPCGRLNDELPPTKSSRKWNTRRPRRRGNRSKKKRSRSWDASNRHDSKYCSDTDCGAVSDGYAMRQSDMGSDSDSSRKERAALAKLTKAQLVIKLRNIEKAMKLHFNSLTGGIDLKRSYPSDQEFGGKIKDQTINNTKINSSNLKKRVYRKTRPIERDPKTTDTLEFTAKTQDRLETGSKQILSKSTSDSEVKNRKKRQSADSEQPVNSARKQFQNSNDFNSSGVKKILQGAKNRKEKKTMYHAEMLEKYTISSGKQKDKLKLNSSDLAVSGDNVINARTNNIPVLKDNLFRGTRREKVCLICRKPGGIVKCQGLCCRTFHINCMSNVSDNNVPSNKEANTANDLIIVPKSVSPVELISENVKDILTDLHNVEEDRASDDLSNASKSSVSEVSQHLQEVTCLESKQTKQGKTKPKKRVVDDKELFVCTECLSSIVPNCFVCNSDEVERKRCQIKECGKFYHMSCLRRWPQASLRRIVKDNDATDSEQEVFTCPQHTCHTCSSDNPKSMSSQFCQDKLVQCILCPTAYHWGNHCIPAGSQVLSGLHIICGNHRQEKSKSHANISWCCICGTGGTLICCELCPNALHAECMTLPVPDGEYICEECDSGRYPLFGEVVWVKCGAYRWWPAKILYPWDIPANIKEWSHSSSGDFVVKFFGSHDYCWVNRGRTFVYQEGDSAVRSTSKKPGVEEVFKRALREAAEEYKLFNTSKEQRDSERKQMPPKYSHIKFNRVVGKAKEWFSHRKQWIPTDCNCVADGAEPPCSNDKVCINRYLNVECTPNVCSAKERCCNQRFEKRQYAAVEPFLTPNRGWGLRSLEDIPIGKFVIEYVGELIDRDEFERRMKYILDTKQENYYFFFIDNSRTLDAGPKGNVSRFINHSCDPNCATEKWNVNGSTRVGLFAIKNIPKGTELTFRYNLRVYVDARQACLCGAKNCAGYIGEKPKPLKESKNEIVAVTKRKKKYDDVCFECGRGGSLICCGKKCTRAYHLKCVNLEQPPEGIWACPWHACNICATPTSRRCNFCPTAFCASHDGGNKIRLHPTKGLVCEKHKQISPPGQRFPRQRTVDEAPFQENSSVPLLSSVESTLPHPENAEQVLTTSSDSAASNLLLTSKENLTKEVEKIVTNVNGMTETESLAKGVNNGQVSKADDTGSNARKKNTLRGKKDQGNTNLSLLQTGNNLESNTFHESSQNLNIEGNPKETEDIVNTDVSSIDDRKIISQNEVPVEIGEKDEGETNNSSIISGEDMLKDDHKNM